MGGLFGGGRSQSTTEKRLQGIDVQRSAYGNPIPLVYGKQRIAGTLTWYGGFKSTPHTQNQGGGKGGGGGASNTTYTYSADIQISLCEGPVTLTTSSKMWLDSGIHVLSEYSFAIGTGAGGQAAWSYLTSNYAGSNDALDHTAWVGASAFQLGNSAALPNMSFEVVGLQANTAAPVNGDAEPYLILQDYLTDGNHGASFNFLGTLTGTNSFQSYCYAMGFFLSPLEDRQRAAREFVQEILEIVNAEAVFSQGLLTFVPRQDVAVTGNSVTYTPNLTPLYNFTDDDYLPTGGDPVQLSRKPADQTFNCITVEYLDRANNYNTAIATYTDDNDVTQNGLRVASTRTYHSITNGTTAKQVAALAVAKNLYYQNQYSFKVRGNYCLLVPMDIVSITDSGLGLSNTVCRVLEVTDNTDGSISLLVEELPVGPGGMPTYAWNGSQGYLPNTNTAPGSVTAPVIFAIPPLLAGPDGGYMIGIAIGAASPSTWGGCQVWMSLDGGTTYAQVGVIHGQSNYGTLTAALASATDKDTTSFFSVSMTNSSMSLGGGSTTLADQMRELCYISDAGGTTPEIVSYGYATATGSGTYGFSSTGISTGTKYLRRGLYGTTPQANAIGATLVKIDNALFRLPIDPGFIGQTLTFKFPSFNQYQQGLQSLASCTAYTYVPSSIPHLNSRGGLAVQVTGTAQAVGSTFRKNGGTTAWDSNVYSTKAISGGCIVSGIVNFAETAAQGAATNYFMMGLTQTSNFTGYTSLDFAMYASSGNYWIYENGVGVTTATACAQGDVIAIIYDGRMARYFVNGVQIRAVPAPGRTLYANVAFYGPYSQLENVEFGAFSNQQLTGGNFLNTWSWKIGTSGNQGNWIAYARAASSSIFLSNSTVPGPVSGITEPIWQVAPNAADVAGSQGQGGLWNAGDLFGVDSTKSYRFSCWVRVGGTGIAGYIYCGANEVQYPAVCNVGTQTVNSNPYFGFVTTTALTANKWYLMVGIIHGSGYTGASTGASGIYDPSTGNLISAWADLNWLAGTVQGEVRTFLYGPSSTTTRAFWARPRFEELNGHEPSVGQLLYPNGALSYKSNVDPSTTDVLSRGVISPTIPNDAFTYTSTTTSVTISWTAMTLYRADGATASISAGSQTVTGLTAGTTYTAYAYAVDNGTSSLSLSLVTSSTGQVGTPAVLLSAAATNAQLAAAIAVEFSRANIPLGTITVSTTSSGTGGGGGGGGIGCLHPDQHVETEIGVFPANELEPGMTIRTPTGTTTILSIERARQDVWLQVEFGNGCEMTVTPTHMFARPDGSLIAAEWLSIGEILQGLEEHLEVIGLRRQNYGADRVTIEIAAPHLYLTQIDGPVSHNKFYR